MRTRQDQTADRHIFVADQGSKYTGMRDVEWSVEVEHLPCFTSRLAVQPNECSCGMPCKDFPSALSEPCRPASEIWVDSLSKDKVVDGIP